MGLKYKRTIFWLFLLAAAFAFGQEQKVCYTLPEMRKITIGLLERREYKALWFLASKQVAVKDSIISEKDKQLILLQKVSDQKEAIISEKQMAIDDLNKENGKLKRRIKWLKFSFAGGAAALGTIVLIRAL